MAFTANDFTKGIDFTAVGAPTAGDHNTLVDAAVCKVDSVNEGKAIIIWSIDAPVNIPSVPNANTTTKWKKYIWMRIPSTVSTNRIPTLYVWNETAIADATYLKWVIFNDLTAIIALIEALDTRVDGVEIAVTNALTAANAANALASQALAAAQSALTTAQAALTTANEAEATADTALATANTAKTTADNAAIVAAGAKTTADTTAAYVAANFPAKYRTPAGEEVVIAGGQFFQKDHGLTGVPEMFTFKLVCINALAGYTVGHEIEPSAVTFDHGSDTDGVAFVCYASSTQMLATFATGAAAYYLTAPGGGILGTFTPAYWKMKVCALKFP